MAMGRPPKDREAMDRAIRLVAAGVSAEDASAAIGGKLAPSTIANEAARRRKERPATMGQAIVLSPVPVASSARGVDLSQLLEQPPAAPPEPLPPDRLERAEFARRLIAAGDLNADTFARLALTWKCSEAEVRAAVVDAASLSPDQALPASLALDESRALARRVRKKAEDAADWKSALMAQKHLDELANLKSKGEAPPGAGFVARSEVVTTLRRLFAALAPWPGAQEAFRAAMSEG